MDSSKPVETTQQPGLSELSDLLLSTKPVPSRRNRSSDQKEQDWEDRTRIGSATDALNDSGSQSSSNTLVETSGSTNKQSRFDLEQFDAHVSDKMRQIEDDDDNDGDDEDDNDEDWEDAVSSNSQRIRSSVEGPQDSLIYFQERDSEHFDDSTDQNHDKDGQFNLTQPSLDSQRESKADSKRKDESESKAMTREELKTRMEQNRLIDIAEESKKLTESRMTEVNSFCGNAVSNFRQKFETPSSEPDPKAISPDVHPAARNLAPLFIANPNSGPFMDKAYRSRHANQNRSPYLDESTNDKENIAEDKLSDDDKDDMAHNDCGEDEDNELMEFEKDEAAVEMEEEDDSIEDELTSLSTVASARAIFEARMKQEPNDNLNEDHQSRTETVHYDHHRTPRSPEAVRISDGSSCSRSSSCDELEKVDEEEGENDDSDDEESDDEHEVTSPAVAEAKALFEAQFGRELGNQRMEEVQPRGFSTWISKLAETELLEHPEPSDESEAQAMDISDIYGSSISESASGRTRTDRTTSGGRRERDSHDYTHVAEPLVPDEEFQDSVTETHLQDPDCQHEQHGQHGKDPISISETRSTIYKGESTASDSGTETERLTQIRRSFRKRDHGVPKVYHTAPKFDQLQHMVLAKGTMNPSRALLLDQKFTMSHGQSYPDKEHFNEQIKYTTSTKQERENLLNNETIQQEKINEGRLTKKGESKIDHFSSPTGEDGRQNLSENVQYKNYKVDASAQHAETDSDGPLKRFEPVTKTYKYPDPIHEVQMDDLSDHKVQHTMKNEHPLNMQQHQQQHQYVSAKLQEKHEILAEKVTNQILSDVSRSPECLIVDSSPKRYDFEEDEKETEKESQQLSPLPNDPHPKMSGFSKWITRGEMSESEQERQTDRATSQSPIRRESGKSAKIPVPILVRSHSKEYDLEDEDSGSLEIPQSPSMKHNRRVSFPVGCHLETLIEPDPDEPVQSLPRQCPPTPMKISRPGSPPLKLIPLRPTTETLFPTQRYSEDGEAEQIVSSDSEGSTTSSTSHSSASSKDEDSHECCEEDMNIVVIKEAGVKSSTGWSQIRELLHENNSDDDDEESQLHGVHGAEESYVVEEEVGSSEEPSPPSNADNDSSPQQFFVKKQNQSSDKSGITRTSYEKFGIIKEDPYDIDFSYGSPKPKRTDNKWGHRTDHGLKMSDQQFESDNLAYNNPMVSKLDKLSEKPELIAHTDPTSRYSASPTNQPIESSGSAMNVKIKPNIIIPSMSHQTEHQYESAPIHHQHQQPVPSKTSRFEKYISMKKEDRQLAGDQQTNPQKAEFIALPQVPNPKSHSVTPINTPTTPDAPPIGGLQKITSWNRPAFSTDSLERGEIDGNGDYIKGAGSLPPDHISTGLVASIKNHYSNYQSVKQRLIADDPNFLPSDDSSEQGIYNVQDSEANCGFHPRDRDGDRFSEVNSEDTPTNSPKATEEERDDDDDDDNESFTEEMLFEDIADRRQFSPQSAKINKKSPIKSKFFMENQTIGKRKQIDDNNGASGETPRILATASSVLPKHQQEGQMAQNQGQTYQPFGDHQRGRTSTKSNTNPSKISGGAGSAFVSTSQVQDMHQQQILTSSAHDLHNTQPAGSHSGGHVVNRGDDSAQPPKSLAMNVRSRSAGRSVGGQPAWAKEEWANNRSKSSDRKISPVQSPPGNVGYLVNIWENRTGGGVIRPLPPEITSPSSLSSGGGGGMRTQDYLRGSMPIMPVGFMMSPTNETASSCSVTSPTYEDQPPEGSVRSMVDLYCTSPPLKEVVKKQFTAKDMFPDYTPITASVPNISEGATDQQHLEQQRLQQQKQLHQLQQHTLPKLLQQQYQKQQQQLQSHGFASSTMPTVGQVGGIKKQKSSPGATRSGVKVLPNKADDIVKYMEMTVSVPDLQTSRGDDDAGERGDGFLSPPNLIDSNPYQDVVQSLENLSNALDLSISAKPGDRNHGRNRLSDLMADLEHDAELQEAFKNRYNQSNSDMNEDSVKSPLSVTSPDSTITGGNYKSPNQDLLTSPPPYEHYRNLDQGFGQQNSVYQEVVHILDQVSSSIDNLNRIPSVPDDSTNLPFVTKQQQKGVPSSATTGPPPSRWFDREFEGSVKDEEKNGSFIDLGPPKPPQPDANNISVISKSLDALGAYKSKLSAFEPPLKDARKQTAPKAANQRKLEDFRPIDSETSFSQTNAPHLANGGQRIVQASSSWESTNSGVVENMTPKFIAPIRPAPSAPIQTSDKTSGPVDIPETVKRRSPTKWASDNFNVVRNHPSIQKVAEKFDTNYVKNQEFSNLNNAAKFNDKNIINDSNNNNFSDQFQTAEKIRKTTTTNMDDDLADAQKWLDRASKTIQGISFDISSEGNYGHHDVTQRHSQPEQRHMTFLPFNNASSRNGDRLKDSSNLMTANDRAGGMGGSGYRYPGGIINDVPSSFGTGGDYYSQKSSIIHRPASNHDIPSVYASKWSSPSEFMGMSQRYCARPPPERLSRSNSQLNIFEQEMEERERERSMKRSQQQQEVKTRSSSASRWADGRPRFAEESAERYLNYKSDFELGSHGVSASSIPGSRLRVIELLNKIR